jgi:hypothetical protein
MPIIAPKSHRDLFLLDFRRLSVVNLNSSNPIGRDRAIVRFRSADRFSIGPEESAFLDYSKQRGVVRASKHRTRLECLRDQNSVYRKSKSS